MPNFTQDWFSHNIPGIIQVLSRLKTRRNFLEIGSFEGMSACWFLRNALDDVGEIVCVDTFGGGADHVVTSFSGVRERFHENVAEFKGPAQTVTVFDCPSCEALAQLMTEKREFDFIYVDGSHTAPDVITDACMGFTMLKKGGLMVFDDYMWGPEKSVLQTPKPAVDAFTLLFRDQINIVGISYQLVITRTTELKSAILAKRS